MTSDLLDGFDWKRAADLTQVSEQALRINIERDVAFACREGQRNGVGQMIITQYGTFRMEVAARLVGGVGFAVTAKLIAVQSYCTVEAREL